MSQITAIHGLGAPSTFVLYTCRLFDMSPFVQTPTLQLEGASTLPVSFTNKRNIASTQGLNTLQAIEVLIHLWFLMTNLYVSNVHQWGSDRLGWIGLRRSRGRNGCCCGEHEYYNEDMGMHFKAWGWYLIIRSGCWTSDYRFWGLTDGKFRLEMDPIEQFGNDTLEVWWDKWDSEKGMPISTRVVHGNQHGGGSRQSWEYGPNLTYSMFPNKISQIAVRKESGNTMYCATTKSQCDCHVV